MKEGPQSTQHQGLPPAREPADEPGQPGTERRSGPAAEPGQPGTGRPAARRRPGSQGGPPLVVPALAYGVLMIASVVLSARTPQPSATASALLDFERSHRTELQVAGFLSFAASAPLAIWAATVYRRLHTLGVTAPGAVIALVGGVLAAASLALSGLISWTSTQVVPVASPALARALADLGFAAGSAGFVVPLGLLLAGVSVPALILRLTSRAWAWFGLVVAAASVLSSLILLTTALDPALPVGRFGSVVFLVAISLLLPRSRPALRDAAALA
jgi:hypothetical protein